MSGKSSRGSGRRVSGRRPRQPRFAVVLFDLDGTLVETRRDIATGVNAMLDERGLGPLSVEQVSRHVGSGARVLVTRCLAEFGVEVSTDTEIDAAYASFHRAYAFHLLDTTRPYDGIDAMCRALEEAHISMAIVSNKPEDLSRRVLEGVGLARYFPVVVGGDSLPVRKPDPAPLFHALKLMGIEAAAATQPVLMVGDSDIDIRAARAAGMPVAAVSWGFAPSAELEAAEPDRLVGEVRELEAWILG
jgi:phosphoglycolate phosphatase